MTQIGDPVTRRHVARGAESLKEEFRGIFSEATVDRFVRESLEALSGSKAPQFVPIFVNRFARERLRALAQSEGAIQKDIPEVLFICVHNAGRSQMAAGILSKRAEGRVHVRSAGSTPAEELNQQVVEAMREIGIDISEEFPKPLSDEFVKAADVVITMGCGDACPIYPGKRYEDWKLDDPAGQDLQTVRRIRDEIDVRVQALIKELAANRA
jgi:arsenate reductase